MENKNKETEIPQLLKEFYVLFHITYYFRKLLFIDKVSGESVGKSECKKCNVAFS
jgi:hypothetical protein